MLNDDGLEQYRNELRAAGKYTPALEAAAQAYMKTPEYQQRVEEARRQFVLANMFNTGGDGGIDPVFNPHDASGVNPFVKSSGWKGNQQTFVYRDGTTHINAPYTDESGTEGGFGGLLHAGVEKLGLGGADDWFVDNIQRYTPDNLIMNAATGADTDESRRANAHTLGAIAASYGIGAAAGVGGAAAGAGTEAGTAGALDAAYMAGGPAGGLGEGLTVAQLAEGAEAAAVAGNMGGGLTAADAITAAPTFTPTVAQGLAPPALQAPISTVAAGGGGAAVPAAAGGGGAAAGGGLLTQVGQGIINNPGAAILAAGTVAGLASGGSLTGSAPEATTTAGGSKYTPEQQSLLKAYTDYYAGLSGDTNLPGYTGNRVAPINDAQAKAENLLMGYTPYAQTDLGKTATNTLTDVMSGGSGKYFEDQYRNVVENPMLRNWTETVVPELTGTFAKKGLLYGTGREEATLKSGRTLAETLTMGRSNLALEMEKQRLAGVTNATQMGNLGLDETTGVSSGLSLTGAQKQATGQKQADADYEAWLRTQPGSRPQDPVIQSILGLSPYYEPTTVVSGGEAGMLGPLLNAAAIYYGQRRTP